MTEVQDEFSSEEDLDLSNLSDEERYAWCMLWLRQAQASNHLDFDRYTHGVFVDMREPAAKLSAGDAMVDGADRSQA